ncbi:MAG: tetratricopeptide repeat protein [Candidatus Zixiibacteriota bacterium]|nr:MAG: tetratricopeptide repeat protein [candidate division Zixibacteria bacterium]
MAVCSNCHAEQPSNDVRSCIFCGYPVVGESGSDETRKDDETLDIMATEADEDTREFVGGQKAWGAKRDDDLGIESTTDLMQQEAERTASYETADFASDYSPIGDSTPPPPPPAEQDEPSAFSRPHQSPTETGGEQAPDETEKFDSNGVQRLSDDDIKEIQQNLYGGNSHLKDQEKSELVKKLDTLDGKQAVSQAAKATAAGKSTPGKAVSLGRKPKMARRGAGIAYFYRNFIQITGSHNLITNDVLTLNDREYLLKPKKFKTPYVIGGSAVVFAIFLIVLASALAPSSESGNGTLVGVVLDEYDQPYIQGATISIPELDEQVTSDQRGFFTAGSLPVGTYVIEYVLGGEVVGTDQASITDDEIRMIFLRPQIGDYSESVAEPSEPRAEAVQTSPPPRKPEPSPVKRAESAPSRTTTKPASKPRTSTYSKVTLDANVPNARFVLDGSVLGAGNLTYSKIKPGTHRYKVSADGYKAVEGRLTLSPGENKQLEVALSPLKQQKKAASYSSDDYFHSGKAAFQQNDFNTAVADLSQVINSKPSHAEAHYYRGESYKALKYYQKAYDDYVRAAEIYQIKKEYGRAITCYNRAVDVDDKSITAYIGRGSLYLKRGEELAAIADFDRARQIDKRSFQAYFGLGEARFKQQQYKKAIDHFKDARSIHDEDPLVHQYLMLSYMALADYKNVKKSYDKFADIATDEQMRRFKTDQKYSAVIRVIESQ